MAEIDLASLSHPISEAEPCGPDLELGDDPDFMQFLARAEGLLPASYFEFDRGSVEFPAEIGTIGTLLERTRDLRLLVLLSKLHILNRDLVGFANSVAAVAALLAERWDDIHPGGDKGDFGMRMAVLQSLDDVPPVVLPLQYAPLFHNRRLGAITYRSHLIATGEAKPREGEGAPDPHAIETAFAEADLADLVAARDRVKLLKDALTRMRAVWIERAGFDQALAFDHLAPLADKMLALLDGAVAKRDPAAALGSETTPKGFAGKVRDLIGGIVGADGKAPEEPASVPAPLPAASGRVVSPSDAAAALAAVAAYFSAHEPSSPAVLLVRQAQQLMGKSFLEVMRILVPAQADAAKIFIGPDQAFDLPVERLSALEASQEAPPASNGRAVNGAKANGGDGSAAVFSVSTRQEARELLQEVGTYYRRVEPSSPVPLLTDRALALAEHDFLSLLKDVLSSADQGASDASG